MMKQIDTDRLRNFPYYDVVRRIVDVSRWHPEIRTGQVDNFWSRGYEFYINDSLGFQICVGVHHIATFNDGSGPTYYRWVGEPFTLKLRQFFATDFLCNLKLHKKPRQILFYRGSDYANNLRWHSRRSGGCCPYLVADSDCGRQYSPVLAEPTSYRTNDVMEEIAADLEVQYRRLLETKKELSNA